MSFPEVRNRTSPCFCRLGYPNACRAYKKYIVKRSGPQPFAFPGYDVPRLFVPQPIPLLIDCGWGPAEPTPDYGAEFLFMAFVTNPLTQGRSLTWGLLFIWTVFVDSGNVSDFWTAADEPINCDLIRGMHSAPFCITTQLQFATPYIVIPAPEWICNDEQAATWFDAHVLENPC